MKNQLNILLILVIMTALSGNILLGKSIEKYQTVPLVTSYKPNAQIVGFIVAKYSNFFRQHNLHIPIKVVNSDKTVLELVSKGTQPIGIINTHNFLLHYANSKHNNVLVISSLLPHMFNDIVVKKTTGIKTLKDLTGKKVAVNCHNINNKHKIFEVLFGRNNIKVDKIIYQNNSSIMPFLFDAVDAMIITSLEDKYSLKAAGFDTTKLITLQIPNNLLSSLPEKSIIINKDYFASHSELAKKMLKLSIQFCANKLNKQNTLNIFNMIKKSMIMNQFNIVNSKESWLLEQILEQIKIQPYGKISKQTIDTINKLYYQNGIITTKLDYNSIFHYLAE